MMTETITQATAFAGLGLSPQNAGSNTTPGYTSGVMDMSKLRRALAVAQVGVLTGTANGILVFQACSASDGTFTNVSGGASVTLSSSNTMGTIEIRADQLPANTRYLRSALYVNNNSAFASMFMIGQESAYKPGSQYNFDTTNTNLVQNVT